MYSARLQPVCPAAHRHDRRNRQLHDSGNFDSTFAAHPEMALYIPLIGGTGGNVGTQSSALIVQGLANSSLDAQNTWKQIVKESVVAVINATIISMLVYIYNFIRFGASAP